MANQKMKTKSAAKKRFTVTGSGNVKAGRKGKRHGFSNKSRKRKRHLKGTTLLTGADEARAKALMPLA